MNKDGTQKKAKNIFWTSKFFLGQIWVNSGKNPSHSQKFACCLLHHQIFREFLVGLLFSGFLELHMSKPCSQCAQVEDTQ